MNNLHKVERWICMHERDTCYRDSIGDEVDDSLFDHPSLPQITIESPLLLMSETSIQCLSVPNTKLSTIWSPN